MSSTSLSEGSAVLRAVPHGDPERETGMIFVDVDDTLVLCDTNADNHPHPYGVLRGEHFTIRHAIVNRPLARSWATVVVWSDGGSYYARTVVKSHFTTPAVYTTRNSR